jgi:ABC-type nickel/cobalt efflux system permease component RcnA
VGTSLPALLLLGFFLGVRHAADPDHVIAVTTIVTRQRSIAGAALIGALWGIGHTLTILLVGGVIIVFGVVVPARLGLAMELAVAGMLVLLGLSNLPGLVRWLRSHRAGLHSHPHSHGDWVHNHPHGHGSRDHGHREDRTPPAWLDRRLGRSLLYRTARPLLVGVVHGLAGSAGVALLVLAAVPHPAWGMAYLALFGIGTVAGMLIVTVCLTAPFALVARRAGTLQGGLRLASGVLSVVFGLWMAYQIGFVDGLFTGEAAGPR